MSAAYFLEQYMRHFPTFNNLRASLARSEQVIFHSQNLRHKAADSEHAIKRSGKSDQVTADWTQGAQA